MFGFLRRKKPAEPVAAPPAPVESAESPAAAGGAPQPSSPATDATSDRSLPAANAGTAPGVPAAPADAGGVGALAAFDTPPAPAEAAPPAPAPETAQPVAPDTPATAAAPPAQPESGAATGTAPTEQEPPARRGPWYAPWRGRNTRDDAPPSSAPAADAPRAADVPSLADVPPVAAPPNPAAPQPASPVAAPPLAAPPLAASPAAQPPVAASAVSAPTPAAVVPSIPGNDQAAPAERRSWMARLKQGLGKTRSNIATLFVGVKIDEALFEDLETALLMSDAGVDASTALIAALRAKVRQDRLTDGDQVRAALRSLVADLLRPLEQPIDIDRATPLVLMITGVNGAGKTTSIGKLAHHLQREGKSILLAAGDTFRAAAREQLAQWGARNDVQVIAQQGGDPAAVAFDAVSSGIARKIGVVMVDTAGRLPTQQHLMEELKKIRRVTAKAMPGAPHESLLVLDGNTGQNMLAQVKAFDDAVSLTGLIVTKLDGTAKGGALVALAHTRRERPIPVYFIGVGEGIDDLQAFSADEFATAMIG